MLNRLLELPGYEQQKRNKVVHEQKSLSSLHVYLRTQNYCVRNTAVWRFLISHTFNETFMKLLIITTSEIILVYFAASLILKKKKKTKKETELYSEV